MNKIIDVIKKLDIPEEEYELYGKYKAKINLDYLKKIKNKKDGKLILVTATNPTPAGEGKTTQSIGISMALNMLNKKSIVALREPSLGPTFGIKGGAIGGGKSTVEPSQDINLHFNGDFHAITSANNLLCAVIDNHIYQGNSLNIDPNTICIKRVIDINDRSLRNITINRKDFSYDTGFELTVASELMAICALSETKEQLKEKIDNIVVAYDYDGNPVFVKNLNVTGAMMALLDKVLDPNIVQTCEGTPALIHLGPFANIAHGCSSVISTKMALKMADYVVTEAGFGSDLGAEKFLDIKCRKSGIKPDICVIVTTIKALKYNGGVKLCDLDEENIQSLQDGVLNLKSHIQNMKNFGLPVIVCLNKFENDSEEEISFLKEYLSDIKTDLMVSTVFKDGAIGAENIAKKIIEILDNEKEYEINFPYELEDDIATKIYKIATKIYGADGVEYSKKALEKIKEIENNFKVNLPICIAKTPLSFTDNPKILGRPQGFKITINDVKINNGAGFIVAYAGNILTLPGLGKKSNYEKY